ncbi:transporter [Autumnicola psychrophila]|uniref:Transporter n=1 Tax=Autumnicola psychrophila TaxID=3075592 RepID=A0ABU3DPW6_9FLAO|nr:transporter [Zunongwangia sp. F225]MDT0685759.1 transporter [Zunongwangia sp. F225]
MKKYILMLAVLLAATGHSFAQNEIQPTSKWTASRPDGHAPISVMADHVHHKGEWMFSYRFMSMNMKGLHSGTDEVSTTAVLENYMISPEEMNMNMHMLGAMYAPTDRLTLMAMTNFISNEMELVTRMGAAFNTSSSGFGDLKFSGLYQLFNRRKQSLHGQLGVSLPTGSIEEMDVTPMSAPNETSLPYPMQIGSGTFDGEAGLTYLIQGNFLSFGSQLTTLLRFGKNEYDYSFGNQYQLNNWIAAKLANSLSISGRVQGIIVEKIEGAHPGLNMMMVPAANPENSGGKYINAGLGTNFYIPSGAFKNVRFALEYAFPLYQDLNGIQLKNRSTFTAGVQYSFH